MTINYNTTSYTSNLQLLLDASNSKSYPGSGTTWYDISGNNRHFTWSGVNYTSAGSRSYFSTNGYTCAGPASDSFGINNSTGYTIITVFNTQTFNGQTAFRWAGSDAYGRGFFLHPGWSNYTLYWDQGGCCNADQRLQITYDSNTLTNFQVWTFRSRLYDRYQFKNGIAQGYTTTYAANINLTSSASYVSEGTSWDGRLAYFALYNTGLDDDTILNISNSLRGRFGV